MNDFILLFRRDSVSKENQPSPEQMQSSIKPWQDWIGSIAAQNKLVSSGNRLHGEGKVVKSPTMVTNGPYVEIKESISGYIIVRTKDFDEAAELAKGCPILQDPWNGNVEVRMIVPMEPAN